MNGYLLVVARDALVDDPDRAALAALRACVTASRNGVLVLADSLCPAPGAARRAAAERTASPPETARPGLLVVGDPPPYDGRPLRSLLLRLPVHPEHLTSLIGWLQREDAELVDLPLELSGHLLHVVATRPRSTGARTPATPADSGPVLPRW